MSFILFHSWICVFVSFSVTVLSVLLSALFFPFLCLRLIGEIVVDCGGQIIIYFVWWIQADNTRNGNERRRKNSPCAAACSEEVEENIFNVGRGAYRPNNTQWCCTTNISSTEINDCFGFIMAGTGSAWRSHASVFCTCPFLVLWYSLLSPAIHHQALLFRQFLHSFFFSFCFFVVVEMVSGFAQREMCAFTWVKLYELSMSLLLFKINEFTALSLLLLVQRIHGMRIENTKSAINGAI